MALQQGLERKALLGLWRDNTRKQLDMSRLLLQEEVLRCHSHAQDAEQHTIRLTTT